MRRWAAAAPSGLPGGLKGRPQGAAGGGRMAPGRKRCSALRVSPTPAYRLGRGRVGAPVGAPRGHAPTQNPGRRRRDFKAGPLACRAAAFLPATGGYSVRRRASASSPDHSDTPISIHRQLLGQASRKTAFTGQYAPGTSRTGSDCERCHRPTLTSVIACDRSRSQLPRHRRQWVQAKRSRSGAWLPPCSSCSGR